MIVKKTMRNRELLFQEKTMLVRELFGEVKLLKLENYYDE